MERRVSVSMKMQNRERNKLGRWFERAGDDVPVAGPPALEEPPLVAFLLTGGSGGSTISPTFNGGNGASAGG